MINVIMVFFSLLLISCNSDKSADTIDEKKEDELKEDQISGVYYGEKSIDYINENTYRQIVLYADGTYLYTESNLEKTEDSVYEYEVSTPIEPFEREGSMRTIISSIKPKNKKNLKKINADIYKLGGGVSVNNFKYITHYKDDDYIVIDEGDYTNLIFKNPKKLDLFKNHEK